MNWGIKMNKVKEIFTQLQSTNSKLEKQKIIKDNANNHQFTDTLVFLLSPYVLTGMSERKINKKVGAVRGVIISWENAVEYLSKHNTGTDHDIALIQSFITNQPEDMQDFYKGLITKSIKLGCDAKTVNSVLGKGFIPSFEIQLAEKYFEKPNKVVGNFTLTEKLDGFRLATIIHNDKIEFYSRQGQLVEGLVEVEEDMKMFCKVNKLHNAFFDGELVAVNCEELSSDENYKVVTKTARSKGIKRGLKYNIFDTLSYEEFILQNCETEYYKRRQLLNELSKNNSLTHINILPVLYNGSDKDMIMEYLNKARENHKEGIMINLDNGMYEFKRTTNLLKVKVMQDADLKIVDVYEGTGKNKGKLGGIIIEFVYKDNTYRCECGSGFSDDERIDYWSNPEKILNKIATIQYFEISKNDNGGYGLRFPVWTHRIREDKTEISMN